MVFLGKHNSSHSVNQHKLQTAIDLGKVVELSSLAIGIHWLTACLKKSLIIRYAETGTV